MGFLDNLLGGNTPDEYEKKEHEKEMAHWMRKRLEQIANSSTRISHQGVWMSNIAAVLGFVGLVYNNQTRSFQPINKASASTRKNPYRVNKLLPTVNNRLAKLCKSPPKYDVRPNGNDQESKDNARFKLDILRAKWDDLELNNKRIPLYMWLQECGHSYMGLFWDDTLGNLMEVDAEGNGIFEGDLRAEVVSAFEVFPDPLAKNDIDECAYFFRAKVRPLSYFPSIYGEKGAEVKEETTFLMAQQFEQRIQSLNTRGPAGGASDLVAGEKTATEIMYCEKPSKKYPKGRLMISAGDVLLVEKELPCGKYPLVKFNDIPVAGKYYPEAIVTHLRPLQDYRDGLVRRRNDWTNKMLKGGYVAARGSNIIKEALTEESGELIYYDPVPNAIDGGAPRPLQIPNIPQYAYMEEDKIDLAFSEISGISEVSKGQLPSASIPALGMQMLVEADDTRIGVITEQHEMAWAKFGSLILDYIQAYYKTPRKLKIAGKNSQYFIKEIMGDDLKGANDVKVVRGSTIPGSKVLRRQDIINAFNLGILGPPNDPKTMQNLCEMLEFGDVGEIYLDRAIDDNKIKREIEEIERGEMPEVHEMDNHVLAIQEMNRYRKSEKWSKLSDTSKEIMQAAIEAHLHEQMKLMGQVEEPMSATATAQASENAEAQALLAKEPMQGLKQTAINVNANEEAGPQPPIM